MSYPPTETLKPCAMRLPSTRIRVSFGSKPRRLSCTVPSPPLGDVLVHGAARLLRDKRGQVGCVTDTELLDVLRPISVHRVRARSLPLWEYSNRSR